MPLTAKNLVRHELIGLEAKIARCTAPEQAGLKGKVIDETYNTLKIEIHGKEKVFLKKNCVFIFTLPDKTKVMVEGPLLVSRPEDRIKKKFPRW